jgi:hypothetical protein
MKSNLSRVTIEDARIIFRNFSGIERPPYNKAGERNFAVVLDPKTAQAMLNDGWNVKLPAETHDEEEETKDPILQVKVNFDKRPPRVVMITSTNRTELNKDTIDVLDAVDFQTVDLIINPSYWEVGNKSGIAAYLKSMYVTIEEDELDRKYAIYDVGD